MVWWLSEGFKKSRMMNSECLKEKSSTALSHDNLFHSVLGLMDVSTQAYEQELDISAACRRIG